MATAAWSSVRAGVVCRMEPTVKPVSPDDRLSSVLPGRLSIASSGDGALRCQAGVFTHMETQRCVEDSLAAVLDSFEVDSASGFKECGLDLPDSRVLCFAVAATSVDEQTRLFHGRRGGGDWYPGLATGGNIEEETSVVNKSEMRASFEAALQEAGRNAGIMANLASRAWRTLGDADRAEALFLMALELAPRDSAIHASYAEFLWQCDV